MDLANKDTIRQILAERGLLAKKSFGQNFLVDSVTIDKIIEEARLSSDENVLEIGPGLGVLTSKLATNTPDGLVLAIEKDRDMVEWLRDKFKNAKNVKILAKDILAAPLSDFFEGEYKVVANIPYAITSPIITKFLLGDYKGRAGADSPRPKQLTLMVQKEVGERIVAKAGERERGVLTVLVELFGKAEIICDVSRDKFFPAPKVDSVVINIEVGEPKANPRVFQSLLKAGFANKRRMLHNSLAGSLHLSNNEAKEILEKAGISPLLRAEQLTLEQWLNLLKEVSKP